MVGSSSNKTKPGAPSSQHNDLFTFKMPDNFYKDDKKKVIGKQTSTSVRRTAMTGQSDESSEDEGAIEMMGDRDPREKLLSERRLDKRERESYKHSFLTKFMEKH